MFDKIQFSNSGKSTLTSSSDNVNENIYNISILHAIYNNDMELVDLGIITVNEDFSKQSGSLSIDNFGTKKNIESLIISILTNVKMIIICKQIIYDQFLNFVYKKEYNELQRILSYIPIYNLSTNTKMIVKKINWYSIVDPEIQDLVFFALKEDYIKIDNALYNATIILKVTQTLHKDNKLPLWNCIMNDSSHKRKLKSFLTSFSKVFRSQLHSNEGVTFSIKSL